jgi:hypothetical protein
VNLQGEALKTAMKERAAEIVANWPPLTEEQMLQVWRVFNGVQSIERPSSRA